jgi:excisionase family DNA binding protein
MLMSVNDPHPTAVPERAPADDQGLSVAQVSARTGRSRQTILRWIAEGLLRADTATRPQGRIYRIHADDAALAALTAPPRRGAGLTVREAAARAKRTPETVRQWIHDGKLPANIGDHPQGRYYDIAPEALTGLISAAAPTTSAETSPDELDATIAVLRQEVRELRALVGLLGGALAARSADDEAR